MLGWSCGWSLPYVKLSLIFLRDDKTFISTWKGIGMEQDSLKMTHYLLKTIIRKNIWFERRWIQLNFLKRFKDNHPGSWQTCVMPLRALSPLDDPTDKYVPQSPTAGLTAVGIRKDNGLFPGCTLLCCSKNNTKAIRAAGMTYIENQNREKRYS